MRVLPVTTGETGPSGVGHDDPDDALVREGWTRRFAAAPPRLGEMVDLYRSLGLDVRVEPVAEPAASAGCETCSPALSRFRVVYTRKTR